MATTRKGSSDGSGKDKKPSKSFTRSNTAPTSRTPKKPSPKPQSPDKNVPNYLKPTLSSKSETSTPTSTSTSISRFLKKKAPDEGSPKTSNRRSLERPPSVQQTVLSPSPKDRISQPVSIRTTSFYPSSTKGGSQSARAVSRDKPSQAPLKSSGSVPSSKPAKTSKRSLTLSAPSNKVTTHHGKASASKKAPPTTPPGFDDNEPLQLGDDIEEIASIGSDADLVPFDQMELSTSADVNNDCLSKKTTSREEEHVPSPVAVQKEEEDNVNKQGKGGDKSESESGSDQKEQSPLADPSDSTTPKREDNHNEREEEVKLAPVAAPVPEEGLPEKGKKQSPVYNDVIKEAASKLLEKRKNKVSALVGAFETVISLQDTDS